MSANSPLEAVRQADEALNRGDIEAYLDFYEEGAAMVIEPGRLVTGRAQLRRFFEVLLSFQGVAKQLKTHVIENGDIALLSSKWSFSGTAPDGSPYVREACGSAIFRRNAEGEWRIVIENPWGSAVLE